MNLLQIIAILVYVLTLFFILFFSTNRFEKDWFKKLSKGKNYSPGGYMYFRIICVVVVVSFILLLKWLGI